MQIVGSRRFVPGVRALALAALALVSLAATGASAKVPGGRHCHNGICHRVMTLSETAAQMGKVARIVASHYDDCSRDRFNPCGLTSSGEAFRPSAADNTASSIHPDGTILVVRNPATRLAAVVRVNNFGPFKGNRRLDLSRAAAEKLGFAGSGVAALDVMVVHAPSHAEATYQGHRRYAPVAGFIGRTQSIEHAYLAQTELAQKQRIKQIAAVKCGIAKRQPAQRLALLFKAPRLARPQA
jgi:rare lipoprotein A